LREVPDHREDAVDLHSPVERPVVRRLDDGAVGDRVAVGEADLDERGAAAGRLFDQQPRRLEIGIAGRQERDEGFLPLALEPGEEGVDGVHSSMSSPWRRATSKQSLSPRPEKLMTTMSVLARRAACRIPSTTAWAVSRAGMIPSSLQARAKPSSASASVTCV